MRMAAAKVVLEARRRNERVKCYDGSTPKKWMVKAIFAAMKIDEYGLRNWISQLIFYLCNDTLENICGHPIALRFGMKFKGVIWNYLTFLFVLLAIEYQHPKGYIILRLPYWLLIT